MEQAVLAEGREWMRRRLEKQLQAASDALEAICPQTGQGLRETRWRDFRSDGTGGVGGGPGMDAPPFGEAVAGGLGCLGGDLSPDGPRLKRNALAGFPI